MERRSVCRMGGRRGGGEYVAYWAWEALLAGRGRRGKCWNHSGGTLENWDKARRWREGEGSKVQSRGVNSGQGEES